MRPVSTSTLRCKRLRRIDVPTNGGSQLARRRIPSVVEFNHVKFDRDEAEFSVIRYSYSDRQSAKFNDLSLHRKYLVLVVDLSGMGLRFVWKPTFVSCERDNMNGVLQRLPGKTLGDDEA
jgi:hypothetical protein